MCFAPALSAEHTSVDRVLEQGRLARRKWAPSLHFKADIKVPPGIRKLEGKHLVLFTDLKNAREIDPLPQIFDAAVVQWAEFFKVDSNATENWRMVAILVENPEKFSSTDLLKLAPKLRHGYSVGNYLWVREQKTGYYRRHLLLHEGVHGFMNHFFGQCGPDWYMEGLAELLATHHWDGKNKKLTIAHFPKNAEESPGWGRIDLLQKLCGENQARSFESVLKSMKFDDRDDTPAYAWSWAAAAFLYGHSRYREVLRDSVCEISQRRFTDQILEKIRAVSSHRLDLEWSNFVANLEYGFDFERGAIPFFSEPKFLGPQPLALEIPADRGWIATGIMLEQGKTYTLRSKGRVQLAKETSGRESGKIWWSEPEGITLRYDRGFPLGTLIGCVVPRDIPGQSSKEPREFLDREHGFFHPFPIGSQFRWTAEQNGALFLRINDSNGELEDNAGSFSASLSREK